MWISKILAASSYIILVAMACGCSVSDGEPVVSPDSMRLRIFLEFDAPASTRATPEDGDYQPGSIYENIIDFDGNDFMVMFFDTYGKYAGALADTSVKETDDLRKKTYIEGEVGSRMLDECGNTLKVLLLANWKGYPAAAVGETTISDLAERSVFHFNPSTDIMVDETRHIPMFGIINTQKLVFDGDRTADLGTVHMLRAYAKIEVGVDEGSFIKSLSEVFMSKVNDTGYMLPPGVEREEDYRKGSFNEDYTSTPAIPLKTDADTDIPFVKTAGGNWIIYVPEFENIVGTNTLEENERARIGVKFEGLEQTFWLDFKYYDNPPDYVTSLRKGDYFNIMRNNWYHYIVSKKPENISVTVDVTPYSSVVLEPDFGLDRDEDGNIINKTTIF